MDTQATFGIPLKSLVRTLALAGLGSLVMLSGTLEDVTAANRAGTAEAERGHALKAARTDWAKLERKVESEGSARVIVQLDIETASGGRVELAAGPQQSRAVGQARKAMLADLGGRGKAKGLTTARGLPLVAFNADATDIAKLRASDSVASVVLDREIKPDLPRRKGKAHKVPASGVKMERARATGSVAGTTSYGSASQLPYWWDYTRIRVDKAVAADWTGAGQTVAILDTGVDATHPWLAGRVVHEACFAASWLGSAIAAGDCPNGYSHQRGTGSARPCAFSSKCAHGTHVAHTAAGYYGVAPGTRIIAVQVFHRDAAGNPTYWESDLIWALYEVYQLRSTYRIAAVNMSLGGGRYTGICDGGSADYLAGWISALRSAGIATVVAAGNDDWSNAVRRPACVSSAVVVGNSTLTAGGSDAVFGKTVDGSNSSKLVDLLAPGTDICSAVPGNRYECHWVGTSMAAPHVTGAMAVLRQRRPGATVSAVVIALKGSGPGVTDSRNGLVRTRINVVGALNRI